MEIALGYFPMNQILTAIVFMKNYSYAWQAVCTMMLPWIRRGAR